MPTVVVPPPYRGPTQGHGEIEAAGATVRACLDDVGRRHPGFVEQILDGQGCVHKFVNLFVNGDEIGRDALDAPIAEGDTLEILAAIGGGAARAISQPNPNAEGEPR